MNDVRVTVCIPHLMRENLLRRCLHSLRSNVGLPYRVIIINDGKHPLSFEDKRIQVINNLERKGIGAARKRFAGLVETEFLFALDNDILVWPGSLEAQIRALDDNRHLAAVSGLPFEKERFCGGIADFEFVGNKVAKRFHNLQDILASPGDLFEANYIPIGHATFRMKAIADIAFDDTYKISYEHWDTFMQFYYADWKCAVHKKSWFGHLAHESPMRYSAKRENVALLEASRTHFIEKWGYQPVEPRRRGEVIKPLRWMYRWLLRLADKVST